MGEGGRGRKFTCLKYFLMSSNAFGLMIGIFLVLFGMAYKEESFPGGYKGKETSGIAGVFIFVTLIGYCGVSINSAILINLSLLHTPLLFLLCHLFSRLPCLLPNMTSSCLLFPKWGSSFPFSPDLPLRLFDYLLLHGSIFPYLCTAFWYLDNPPFFIMVLEEVEMLRVKGEKGDDRLSFFFLAE